MKKILVLGAIWGLLFAPAGWAEDSSQSMMASNALAQEIQTYINQLDELQDELKTIESRAFNLEMRPYLDPKGFKRQALKRLMEKKKHEYAALEQKVTELKSQAKGERRG